MPGAIVFSPEAALQLRDLRRYIRREATVAIARHYVDAIVARCESLADAPFVGTPRDDLRPGLRSIAFRRRVTIVYAVHTERVEILGSSTVAGTINRAFDGPDRVMARAVGGG